MTRSIQKKLKVMIVCLFLLLTCTACSAPRARDGKTKVDQIISSETVTVKKSDVNVTEIKDEKLAKKYAKLDDDAEITIEPTTFKQAIGNGWFDGLIVWPLATLINKVAAKTDAGIGIIVATLLLQLVLFALTGKSQMSSQRMQEIQPELQAIQNKYKGRTDQQSQMKMYSETQELYKKYDIHPFGSILVMFLQLPIMMGMYYATMRAASVIYGTFMGIRLSLTPMQGIRSLNVPIIIIYALMIICQFVTTQLPKWLKKYQDKKDNVRVKKYKQDENQTQNTMNMYMYMMTIMFAFIYVGWPTAMSFYWVVTSIIRIIQNIVLHKAMHKN